MLSGVSNPEEKMKTIETPKLPTYARKFCIAVMSGLFMSAVSIADVSAQGRSNKGGEVRGKDRATQMQEMNNKAKGSGKEEAEAVKEKKEKKAKKEKGGKKKK